MDNNIIITYKEQNDKLITRVDVLSENFSYPLNVYFTTKNKIIWETTLYQSNTWCSLPDSRNLNVRIIDNNGELIYNKPWVLCSESDICELEFIKWCQDYFFKTSKKPKGIVIGTHDGSHGEWVESYKQNLIGNTLLIEPNIKPFNQLVSNYQHDNIFQYKNVVVSDSDNFVEFFTDSNRNSESSSLLLNNLLKNNGNHSSYLIKSITPNKLLDNFECDWLHIDAEGYDAELILLLSNSHLNNLKFIIWEHIHLDDETKIRLQQKLESFGFTVKTGKDYNTFAKKI